MKKMNLILLACVLAISMTACASKENNTNQPHSRTNQSSSTTKNQSDLPQDTDELHADTSFVLDDLIDAVKKTGAISEKPENIDVGESGAQKAVAYGNIVFLTYGLDDPSAIIKAEETGKITLNGKTVKVAAQAGPYVMVFLDGNVDQSAVKAFRAIGFGY